MDFTCFPPASGQSPSAFLTVQLQRLEARDISQAIQKGKDSLFGCPVLCLSPLGEPPPLFLCPAPGLRGTCHKPNHPRRQRPAFLAASSYATRLWTKPFRFSYTQPLSYCFGAWISSFSSFAALRGQYGSLRSSLARRIKSARSFWRISSA
jgi:hypothetical protein